MAGFTRWVLTGLMAVQLFYVGMAWTGQINGRVFCDVCADGSMGPEDYFLEGAEVAVLCLTKSGEVLNYQAFTNSKGTFTVAETMPESNRWQMCLARQISSIHQYCNILGDTVSARKFSYSLSSGRSYTVRPFSYQPVKTPMYCQWMSGTSVVALMSLMYLQSGWSIYFTTYSRAIVAIKDSWQ